LSIYVIRNSTFKPIHISSADIFLANGLTADTLGFKLDSIIDQDLGPSVCTQVKITFTHVFGRTVFDSLIIMNDCQKNIIPLTGNGGIPDFTIGTYSFDCTLLDSVKFSNGYFITVPISIPVSIDSLWVDDMTNFGIDPNNALNKLPIFIPADGYHEVIISFHPHSAGLIKTNIHAKSGKVVKTDTISGVGCANASVIADGYSSELPKTSAEYFTISLQLTRGGDLVLLPPTPNPVTNGRNSVRFIFGLGSAATIDLSLYDILGNNAAKFIGNSFYQAGIYEVSLPIPSNLIEGTYFYRLSTGSKVLSGKLIIIR